VIFWVHPGVLEQPGAGSYLNVFKCFIPEGQYQQHPCQRDAADSV